MNAGSGRAVNRKVPRPGRRTPRSSTTHASEPSEISVRRMCFS
jgi:hypothetical protein